MIERIFNDPVAWGILGGVAGLAFLSALIFESRFEGDSSAGDSVLRGVEAVILSLLGGLLARAFISLLLGWANDSAAAGLAVGWGFFLIPGIVDTIPYLTHSKPILTTPENLLMFATVVGSLSGAAGGLWRVYSWTGLGWIGFPLDVTWALAGNTVGCLLHSINFIGYWISQLGDGTWGVHGSETRENAHRYQTGFGLRPGFAFTQGAVMSNLSDAPGADLYRHERTHVWQNRAFGPMYTLTYVGWIVVWVAPSVVGACIVAGLSRFYSGPNDWCYFNNPWETWAYKVQNAERTSIIGVDDEDRKLIWPAKWVIAWSIPFFLVATLGAALVVNSVWIEAAPQPVAPQTQSSKAGQKPKPQPKGGSQPKGNPHGAPAPKHH